MAMYDNLGVPVLGFHNPAGSTFYPNGLYTYAMGNTRGRDVTETLGTSTGQHLDLLLLASGDVRNVLVTISELSLRKAKNQPQSINFHVNDYDPSVVARNVVILELADTINPDVTDDIDFLWNVWYNITLSQAHLDRLREVLTSLIKRNFDGDESFLKFQKSNVLNECRDIWIDWRELDLDVNSVKQERNQFIKKKLNMVSLCTIVVYKIFMVPYLREVNLLRTSPLYQEIEHWFREGSTNDELATVNPTLIRPFLHKWKVHYAACAFEGYLPLQRDEFLKSQSCTAACKERLKLLVKQFQQLKHITPVQVTSWTGDALWLCTSGFPRKLLFDVIDTGNVSDHIGLLNVLVCCETRLKRPLESQLFTSSILWCLFCESFEEYYNKCVGVHHYLLPTVLGLKLSVDFDLGSRNLPDKINSSEETLCWVKTETARTLLNIDERSDIVQALHSLAERCFNPSGEFTGQECGVTLPSPLTLLRIVQQIDPILTGGAGHLLDLVHGKLPPDFYEKFGLSWNLIRASIEDKKEPIVEITVHVVCSVPTDQTPMPMVVINNENEHPMDSFFDLFLPKKGMVIYNSLRYDTERHTVKFHLVEKDWNELKEKSQLTIKANNWMPFINSETVFLGDKGGATLCVTQVDPVATFGLFSVQTFNVCTLQEDHLLEMIKVEESEYSYKAELGMRDPSKCKKSNIKINYLPDSCPTAVNINFGEVIGCTLYFSCSIEKSSKFQISRKQGKITCQIPKRQDGTVGELVLRNPAPIPFHALHRGTAGLDNVIACSKMFRTKLDMLIKSQRESGSPFFNLRESIFVIFKMEHEKQPMIPNVYYIDVEPLIKGSYQTMDDILLKRGFVILVDEVYVWKCLPVAKIIFYDCKLNGDVSKNLAAPEVVQMMESFFRMISARRVHRIPVDQKEIDLFRKMLRINAARIEHEQTSNPVWVSSFVCPIFPQAGISNLFDFGNAPPSVLSCIFDSGSIPSQQIFDVPASPESGIKVDTVSSSLKFSENECSFCQKRSENLKKCTGCKKVFYCNKSCQGRHWKLEHKIQCQKM